MQWTVYGIFFSEMIGYKTVIFFNFWRPFYFLLPFFFGIRQSATRLFILFNFYIHWVFIFFNIHFFVLQAICNKTVAVESTPLSLTGGPLAKYDPKLGTTQSRKFLKQKMTTMSSKKWWGWYCVYWPHSFIMGMGVRVVQFCKKKFVRILMYKYLCELKLHTVGVGDDEVGDKWKYM